MAVIISLPILAACDAKSVRSDFSFKPEKTDGIVIISVTQDAAAGKKAIAIFYLDYDLASGKAQILTSLHQVVPGIGGSSDFEDGEGQVFVLALPAGKHKIDSWQIRSGWLEIHPKEHPTPLVFEVAAGQIKYLGNLHANLGTGKNVFGMTSVGNGYPEVRDERNRDISMIDFKYPQFRGKVVYELLPLGPWTSSAETTQYLDLPPPPQTAPAKR